MIARVSTIAAIASTLAASALAKDVNIPFDVSLSLSGAYLVDLSSVYKQVIREATDRYRGDFPDYGVFVVTTRAVVRQHSRFPTSAINTPRELQEDFDPFPQVPFTLSRKPEDVAPHP
jgi:hypothetical protein